MPSKRIEEYEVGVKTYFANLPTKKWLMFVVPAVMLAYPLLKVALPVVVHAVVPEAVRRVLQLM